jgi:class 3 adenylate cyclase
MPETLYADCNGSSIAYQVMGEGPPDIIKIPGIFSHVELYHEFPQYTEFFRKLSAFSRVIAYDKLGQGLSDRISSTPSFEERTDDLVAVMDATGSERAVLFGISEGSAMALLFAAIYPDRVSHVITFGGYAKSCAGPNFPHMPSYEERSEKIENWIANWGKGDALRVLAPRIAESDAARRLFGRIERSSCSPSAMRRYFDLNLAIDIRDILPTVQVPTLVMHHEGDGQVPFSNSEYLVSTINGAKLANCGPGGHYCWSANIDGVISDIRAFLSLSDAAPQRAERVLATVLFTDIVDSTRTMSKLGDGAWREVLDRHDAEAADLVELHRGKMVKSTGDGILASFDSPGRAVQCARALVSKAQALDLHIRAGLHTGEIELRGADISGTAVHAAARIEETAGSDEVIISRTMVDLMAGNDAINLESIGKRDLKGLAGEWELFRVVN